MYLTIFTQISLAQSTNSDDGYLTYSTENHPKANGLKITMKYPSDWEAEEGDRPHIVQKFISPSRLSIFMIYVREIPGYVAKAYELIDENDFDETFDFDVAKEFIPKNAKLIDKRVTKIEGLLTFIVEYSSYSERAEFEIYTQNILYLMIYKKNAISFQALVADAKGYENRAKNRMRNTRLTFQKMVNSVVIHNKWEEEPDDSYEIYGIIFFVIVGGAIWIAINIYRKSKKNNAKRISSGGDNRDQSISTTESIMKNPEFLTSNEEQTDNINYIKNLNVNDSTQSKKIGIGRFRYLINFIVTIAVSFFGLYLILSEENMAKLLIGTALVISAAIFLIISTIKRLKNIGYSPWLTLLLFLHAFAGIIIFICLVFRENYSIIKKHDLPAKIVLIILVGVLLAGIIMAFIDF